MYQRIRDLREDHEMTQTQISKILSCSQRVYSNYERGDIDIPTAVLIKLADFHGVSVDYLLNRTDNPKRDARRAAANRPLSVPLSYKEAPMRVAQPALELLPFFRQVPCSVSARRISRSVILDRKTAPASETISASGCAS